jgi:amino acid transporter
MESKQVNLWKSVLFTVCSILVLDTFVAPAIIGVSSITIWIITAILFFIPYGLLSAELGSTYPDDGGIYSWVNRAFGEKTAVMVGWYYSRGAGQSTVITGQTWSRNK